MTIRLSLAGFLPKLPLVLCLAGAVAMPIAAPIATAEAAPAPSAPKPPEAKPDVPAQLTFTYQRKKITQCAFVQADGERSCEATAYADDPGTAEVNLTPIDKEDEVDASRAARRLQFAARAGVQTETVELKKGRWELEWKGGSTARERFFVVASDRFEVALEAIVGLCSDEGGSCKLEASMLQQSIELPERRGVE